MLFSFLNLLGLVAKQSIRCCHAVKAAIFISGTTDLKPSSIIGSIVLVNVPLCSSYNKDIPNCRNL